MHICVEARDESLAQSFEEMVEEIIVITFEGINEGMNDYNQTNYAVWCCSVFHVVKDNTQVGAKFTVH
jgi:hypothetical protein